MLWISVYSHDVPMFNGLNVSCPTKINFTASCPWHLFIWALKSNDSSHQLQGRITSQHRSKLEKCLETLKPRLRNTEPWNEVVMWNTKIECLDARTWQLMGFHSIRVFETLAFYSAPGVKKSVADVSCEVYWTVVCLLLLLLLLLFFFFFFFNQSIN